MAENGFVSRGTRSQLVERIESLRMQLMSWRWTWENLDQNSVQQRPFEFNLDGLGLRRFKEVLSTALVFENPTRAAELLTYNAAMIELIMLRCGVSDEEARLDTPIQEFGSFPNECTVSAGQSKRPTTALLLPNELEWLWQPAIEALRILAFTRKQFFTGDAKLFLSLSPIGILYSCLRKFGMQNLVVDAIGHSFDLQLAEQELVHRLDARLTLLC